MAKILVLAKSGFGKTTSWAGREKLDIKGLNPEETFVIQCIRRGVPNKNFVSGEPIELEIAREKGTDIVKVKDKAQFATVNRVSVDHIDGLNRYRAVVDLIEMAKSSKKYKNIIVDDFNYLSQDYYMAKAMKGGWDTPKEIGYGMGLIFNAMKGIPDNKNIICLAHYEEYKDKNGDSISYKFKTTGKMVDDYITPEGNFDIILFGKTSVNGKNITKEFVKEFDGEYPAKDSIGALDDMPDTFKNDLSIVIDHLKEIYG